MARMTDNHWLEVMANQPNSATLSTALTGNNNDLVYTAVNPGSSGNDITVAYVDPSAASQSLSVSVSGKAISVSLATNGGSAITSTAALVKAAIQASPAASDLVTVANKASNDGTGVVTALAATNLSGGGIGSVSLAANSSVNLAQVAGTTTDTNSGNKSAGTQRVVLATDQPTVPVAGSVASGATDSGNPVKTGGKYNSSAPTLTDGQRGDTQLDASANTLVTLATKIAGEDLTNDVHKVEQRFSYTHIAAGQATTTVKSGAGFLHNITLNGAATATNVTTIYDNTAGSGTVIAIPAATTATVPTTLTYDVSFATGLTIVTATANGADMTISWR